MGMVTCAWIKCCCWENKLLCAWQCMHACVHDFYFHAWKQRYVCKSHFLDAAVLTKPHDGWSWLKKRSMKNAPLYKMHLSTKFTSLKNAPLYKTSLYKIHLSKKRTSVQNVVLWKMYLSKNCTTYFLKRTSHKKQHQNALMHAGGIIMHASSHNLYGLCRKSYLVFSWVWWPSQPLQ